MLTKSLQSIIFQIQWKKYECYNTELCDLPSRILVCYISFSPHWKTLVEIFMRKHGMKKCSITMKIISLIFIRHVSSSLELFLAIQWGEVINFVKTFFTSLGLNAHRLTAICSWSLWFSSYLCRINRRIQLPDIILIKCFTNSGPPLCLLARVINEEIREI